MVAISINGETVVKGQIRPLFERADGSLLIGEPVSPIHILRLRKGDYDCKRSIFVGWESCGNED